MEDTAALDARAGGMHLPREVAFWLLGAVLGFLLFASSAPSPLYVIYQTRWHFSAAVLTGVFAIYSLGVMLALLLVGALSDVVGRRPVLLVALAAVGAAMALFAAAQAVAWLFAARALQGLATGAATGAIGAALLDLQPSGDTRRGPLVNTAASSIGLASGALVAGLLVTYGPAPTLLIYFLLLGVFALALACVWFMPETVGPHADGEVRAWRPRRVAIPRAIRRPFVFGCTGIIAAWSVGGLYLSLGPSLASGLLHSHSHVVGGLVVFVLTGVGAMAQVRLNRWESRRAMRDGALLLIVGLALVVVALGPSWVVLFFLGTAVLGVGWGIAFMGSFRVLSGLAPDGHRAEVLTAIYMVAYSSMSVPAIIAGVAVGAIGLHATATIFAGIVALLAAFAAISARPERRAAVTDSPLLVPCPCTIPPAHASGPLPAQPGARR
jgi:MFS family permease